MRDAFKLANQGENTPVGVPHDQGKKRAQTKG